MRVLHSAGGDNLLLMGRYKKGKYEHSMFGSLTDINIWDSILSLEEIKQWKSFSPSVRGDIVTDWLLNVFYHMSGNVVDWNTATWNAENLQEIELELETIQEESYKSSSYQVFITERRKNFADSLKFCQDIGGVLAVAESNMNLTEMIETVERKDCGGIFWTGWTDEREEGQFVSAVTGEKMEWQDWIKGFI